VSLVHNVHLRSGSSSGGSGGGSGSSSGGGSSGSGGSSSGSGGSSSGGSGAGAHACIRCACVRALGHLRTKSK
jgi:hypothetical protein